MKWQDDRVISALAQYLGAATRASLRGFSLRFFERGRLSEAGFLSLCDGIADSPLRDLALWTEVVDKAYLCSAAESLAQAISRSSLEEVTILSTSLLRSALSHTQPVQNLDFAISEIKHGAYYTS
jgi:hypothetical protein